MNYEIAAHETCYANTVFRSRLEARWACLFDLIKWQWEYEPIDLVSWTPDFRVVQPCNHSECSPHEMYAEVKPYYDVSDFKNHVIWNYDGSCAMLGQNTDITLLRTCHTGGLDGPLSFFYDRFELLKLWSIAGNRVQWQPRG